VAENVAFRPAIGSVPFLHDGDAEIYNHFSMNFACIYNDFAYGF
jgi:hypothetical protein